MKSTDSRWLAKGKQAMKHYMTRCFIALALTLVLTGLLALNGASTSYAAGYQLATSGNAHTQISSSGTPQSPKVECYAPSIGLYDDYQGNHTDIMGAYWCGAATFLVSVNINFGDRTSASYQCWANCTSGETTWHHRFPAANRTYRVTSQLCWSGSCYASFVTYVNDPQ
jgi:hypothetical protein